MKGATLTPEQKDARKAERLNAKRFRHWQDSVPSLFDATTCAEPALLTGADIAAKRERDKAIGQAALDRVHDLDRQCEEQADLMREVFALFRGEYLARLRENSITGDMRRFRWTVWEKHLHSIGVVVAGVLDSGEVLQVTAAREEGMAIFGEIDAGRFAR